LVTGKVIKPAKPVQQPNARKDRRRAQAADWERCARIPQIDRICRKVVGGYEIDSELRAF
jgi:hypothetical protein